MTNILSISHHDLTCSLAMQDNDLVDETEQMYTFSSISGKFLLNTNKLSRNMSQRILTVLSCSVSVLGAECPPPPRGLLHYSKSPSSRT